MSAPPTKRRHAWGLIIPLVLFILLFIGAGGFASWAYSERQTYKDHSDKKSAVAVEAATKALEATKEKEFVEREKLPHKIYKGPAIFGSVELTYPKTWSGFVTIQEKGQLPVVGYFYPNVVPGVDSGSDFALRVEVSNQPFSAELGLLESKIKQGDIRITPFRAARVPGVLGARVDGELNRGQKDSMVMFAVRDKTLKVWTESDQFLKDFNEIVLPQLIFTP
jgi:hypothetical protein